MTVKATSLPAEVQRRIDTHLNAIDHVLDGSGVPSDDRVAIVGEVELQVRDMLAERCSGDTVPSIADVEAVLTELDPPESYVDRDTAAAIAAPTSTSIAGRVSLGLTLTGLAIVIVIIALAAFESPLVSSKVFSMTGLIVMLIFPLAFGCGLVGWRSTSGRMGAVMSGVCCLLELAFFVLTTRIPG